MSLLEDIFLQDEANEARQLERIIEGDLYDESPRSLSASGEESDNDKREDEAEEDKRRVDPLSTKTKRVTRNPRFTLNPARLTGPRGIQVIPEHFKDFNFKGKGHEKEDLDMLLKKLEHWAYRLYPKFQFHDCLKKIETLGKKRPVMVHLHKIRTDQFLSEETVMQKDSSDEETQPPQEQDEFDKLLQQQIELARATPAPGSVTKPTRKEHWQNVLESQTRDDRLPLTVPKATSSPSISEEQKERMLRNRKSAEERRLARLKQATRNNTITIDTTVATIENTPKDTPDIIENILYKKINRSRVRNSSDSEEECNIMSVKQSIVVDVYDNIHIDEDKKGCEETNIINDGVGSIATYDEQNASDKIDITRNNEENVKENNEIDKDNYVEIIKDINICDDIMADGTYDKENVETKERNSSIIDVRNGKENLDNYCIKDQDEPIIIKEIEKESIDNIVELKNDNLNAAEQKEVIRNITTDHYVGDIMDIDFSQDF